MLSGVGGGVVVQKLTYDAILAASAIQLITSTNIAIIFIINVIINIIVVPIQSSKPSIDDVSIRVEGHLHLTKIYPIAQ